MSHGVQYVCYIDETGYYLGDAEQIAEFLNSPAEEITSTWVPANADGNLTLIRTSNVQSLWKALGTLALRYKAVNLDADMDQTVHLFMPCGVVARFIAFDDLPWTSQSCPCGDPRHWLIRYTDEYTE